MVSCLARPGALLLPDTLMSDNAVEKLRPTLQGKERRQGNNQRSGASLGKKIKKILSLYNLSLSLHFLEHSLYSVY